EIPRLTLRHLHRRLSETGTIDAEGKPVVLSPLLLDRKD
ncbi:MAG: hypothetical protein ACI9CV_001325, partial [Ilumatobacter sp.]